MCVGILAAAGSIFISQKLFSAKTEQIFFALFLVAIAAFYLAFTAYILDQGAWRLETEAVIVFAVFGILGLRLPAMLIIGSSLHGIWDLASGPASCWCTALFAQLTTGVLPAIFILGGASGMPRGRRMPGEIAHVRHYRVITQLAAILLVVCC